VEKSRKPPATSRRSSPRLPRLSMVCWSPWPVSPRACALRSPRAGRPGPGATPP